MSSDPGAPDIKEVFSNDSSKLDKDQTHYNLIPTSDQPTQHEHREKPEAIHNIQRSISRQETTLSSIMNLIGDNQDQSSFPYDVTDISFDEFTAG